MFGEVQHLVGFGSCCIHETYQLHTEWNAHITYRTVRPQNYCFEPCWYQSGTYMYVCTYSEHTSNQCVPAGLCLPDHVLILPLVVLVPDDYPPLKRAHLRVKYDLYILVYVLQAILYCTLLLGSRS